MFLLIGWCGRHQSAYISVLSDAQRPSNILVDHIAYTHSWYHLHEVRRYATVQTTDALLSVDGPEEGDHGVLVLS